MRQQHFYKQYSEQPDGTVWCIECKSYHQKLRKVGRGQSAYHNLLHVRKYIMALAIRDGRNLEICEMCGSSTNGRPVFHHPKYEGATYYDLKIACNRCNTQTENKLLS